VGGSLWTPHSHQCRRVLLHPRRAGGIHSRGCCQFPLLRLSWLLLPWLHLDHLASLRHSVDLHPLLHSSGTRGHHNLHARGGWWGGLLKAAALAQVQNADQGKDEPHWHRHCNDDDCGGGQAVENACSWGSGRVLKRCQALRAAPLQAPSVQFLRWPASGRREGVSVVLSVRKRGCIHFEDVRTEA
jgi:hypothetical protein